MADDNKRGVVLLSDLSHDGMLIPATAEIEFGDDEYEAALVAAGIARWGKGAVPESITPLQAMAAIEAAGMSKAFDAALKGHPSAAQMFNLATEIRRNSGIVESLRVAAEKTQGEIDDLFRRAAAL